MRMNSSNHIQTQKPLKVKGREPVLRKIYVMLRTEIIKIPVSFGAGMLP